jgi:hypothetical protein
MAENAQAGEQVSEGGAAERLKSALHGGAAWSIAIGINTN